MDAKTSLITIQAEAVMSHGVIKARRLNNSKAGGKALTNSSKVKSKKQGT
jgi:hypothetical protein